HYPRAEKIHVVLDNLSTHSAARCTPIFPAPSAADHAVAVRTTVPRYQSSPSGYLLNARLASGEPHIRACAGPSAFQRPGRKATRQRAKDRYRYGGESECPTCADAIEPPG